jgi:hypothetical protein
MPSNCIFCNAYKQYRSSTNFIINYYRAPYKTYNSYRVNSFFSLFLLTTFLTLYIGEKKETVLTTTFSGPSAAYKLNYSRYYFRRYFRCCFSLYFLPPYTARINLATTYYSPPYYGAARLWSYCYYPPYYRVARS